MHCTVYLGLLTGHGTVQELRQEEFSEHDVDETQLVDALAEQPAQEAELVAIILCARVSDT